MLSHSLSAADISGRITDSRSHPLPGINVYLLTADSQFVQVSLTDDNGQYLLEQIPAGNYLLKVTAAGYMSYLSGIIHIANDPVHNDITLTKVEGLKEVAVRGLKPLVEMKDGKLVVNVENSIISAGSSVMEVLTRSPGVKTDQNDNIMLKGRAGVLILIDGRRQPVAGSDLANILKAIPAEQVERIEIISEPPARYDAAGTAGIINIITRRSKGMGLNGTINAGYGQGIYPKVNTGTAINYRNNKISLYANASYSYRKGINYQLLDRHFFESGNEVLRYDQEDNALFPVKTFSGSAGIEYNLSGKTTVGASASSGTNRYNVSGSNHSNSLDANGGLLSYFNTVNTSRDRWQNYAVNTNLRHKFDSTGRVLTVDADHARYSNNTQQDFFVNYYTPSGAPARPQYHLHGDLHGNMQIYAVKADHVMNIKKFRHEAGIKSSYVTADNEPLFYDRSNGGNVYDTTKSNHFLYSENINAAYTTFTREWAAWSMQLGVRAEHTMATGKQLTTGNTFNRNYAQLFPSMWVQHKVNADNEVGLSISRRIERPVYKQLNPFKFFVDPTEYDEGNPYLLPALSYSADITHTFKQRFITTFSYSITNRVITEVVKTDEYNSKINAQIEVNLNRLTYYSLSTSYPFTITKWWNSAVNANLYYCHYDGSFAGTGLNRGKPSADLNITNSLILPASFTAEVSMFYQAPQVYAFMDMGQYGSLNAGIQKNLWDKKATIKLNAADIFWTSTITGTSRYASYWQTFVNRRDARIVTLSFVYRFGKRTVPAIERKAGGAADERKGRDDQLISFQTP